MLHYILDRTAKMYGRGNGATGTLETRVVNSGTIDDYIDSEGAHASLNLDGDFYWINDKKISWLAPEMKYSGRFHYEALRNCDVRYKGTPVSESAGNRLIDVIQH